MKGKSDMGGAKFLIALSVAALVFAGLTGDIHRQDIWQGSLLVILASFGVLSVRRKAPLTATSKRAGKTYVAIVAVLTCALIIARQTTPMVANWLFATTVLVFVIWIGFVFQTTRSVN